VEATGHLEMIVQRRVYGPLPPDGLKPLLGHLIGKGLNTGPFDFLDTGRPVRPEDESEDF